MSWINVYGAIFVAVLLAPNVIFALRNKKGFRNLWECEIVYFFEKIGRFGCLALMILILPGCGFGFPSNEVFALYLASDGALVALYCLMWAIRPQENSLFKALALSLIPSVVFLLSGALSGYWPLLIAAAVFAPCHVAISYKNAEMERKRADPDSSKK